MYKDLLEHVHALRRLIGEFTLPGDPLGNQPQ
ncbi:hypothetical protein EG865_15450, partial [Enterococcus faecalis]